jgi:hypothetical protein
MTVAVLRRRGVLALLAGLIFLLGRPIYQSAFMNPAGYVFLKADDVRTFGPYLAWAATHLWVDLGSRVVEVVPFLLATLLPGPLRLILYGRNGTEGRSAMLFGQLGFGLFVVVLLLGFFIVPNAAHDYLAHPATRAQIARGYYGLYQFETVAATVVGLGMIALSLAMMSLRGIATGRFPPWYAYVGLATAGLLAATAVFALFGMNTAAAQAEQFSLPALALWLIVTAALLLRVQTRERTPAAVGEPTHSVEPAAPAN